MADTLVTADPTAPVPTPASPVTPSPAQQAPVAPISPGTPAADWRASLPDDLKADKSLEKFKDTAALARSYKTMEAYQGRSVAIPGPDAKPEERDAFWAKVGRPETPEKYTLPIPENVPVDEGVAGDFKQTAHRLGLTQDQVAGLSSWFTGSPMGNPVMAGEKLRESGSAALHGEWGGNFDNNIAIAQRGAQALGKEFVDLMDATGLGNHPVMVKIALKEGLRRMEAGDMPRNAQTGGILSPQDAQRQIDAMYADKSHPIHGGQGRAAQEAAREEMHLLFQLKAQSGI